MSAKQTIRFVILWEEEVRKAAVLLMRAGELLDAIGEEPVGGEAAKAIWAALDACRIALHGADTAEAVLMLSAHRITPAEPLTVIAEDAPCATTPG